MRCGHFTVLTLAVGLIHCDFTCICNYNVEKTVFPDKSETSAPLGYLYEFDCKPSASSTTDDTWIAIAYEHQMAYIKRDAQIEVQTCPGKPSPNDLIPTTTTQAPTTTTPVPTTITKTPMPTTPTTTHAPTKQTTTRAPTTPTTTHAPTTKTTTHAPTTPTTTHAPTTPTTTRAPTTKTTTHMPTTPTTTHAPTTSTTTHAPTTPTTTHGPTTPTTTHAPTTPTTTHAQTTTRPATTVSSKPHVTEVSYGCPQKYFQLASHEHGTLFEIGKNCYEIVPTDHTWTYAENDCKQRGGHLVHITSSAEHTAIYQVIVQYHGDHVWIGLNDRDHEEHFQWSSGDSVNYTNFYSGRKDILFHGTEDCVTMWMAHHNGKWEDVKCGNKYGYVCEYDAVLSSHLVTTMPPSNINSDGNTHRCPTNIRVDALHYGYILSEFEGRCYEILPGKVIWTHAEYLCKQRGGHLTQIGSAHEQSFIDAFMSRHNPNKAVWIGLHDLNTEGHFQWTTGERVSYTNWLPGHLDNFVSHTAEDCIALIPYKNGKWDDIPCGSQDPLFGGDIGETHYSFCEYKAASIPTGAGAIIG